MGRAITEREQTKAALSPGQPSKPAGLSIVAAKEWDRITAELGKTGITLSPARRITLTVCATLAADIKDCWAVLQANGGSYTKAGTGAVKLHPAAARLDVLRRDLTKALALLGLTKPTAELPDEPDEISEILAS